MNAPECRVGDCSAPTRAKLLILKTWLPSVGWSRPATRVVCCCPAGHVVLSQKASLQHCMPVQERVGVLDDCIYLAAFPPCCAACMTHHTVRAGDSGLCCLCPASIRPAGTAAAAPAAAAAASQPGPATVLGQASCCCCCRCILPHLHINLSSSNSSRPARCGQQRRWLARPYSSSSHSAAAGNVREHAHGLWRCSRRRGSNGGWGSSGPAAAAARWCGNVIRAGGFVPLPQ